uniref:WKF domain-containing protein n=2 Tax=Schistosoma mansoni TaxID=6183 RepID=A0A3Q0KCS8_SCHMA
MWHDDHKNWKFKKLPQSWLIKNALDRKMIPSSEFRIFKLYIKGLVGYARQDLLSQCSKTIEEQTDGLETNTELVNRGDMSLDNIIGQQKLKYSAARKRAKRILAVLSKTSDV